MDVKVKNSREAYTGRIFTLHEDVLEFSDGHASSLSYIRHPGACVIVPFFNNDTLLLVKQYRYAVKQYIWEFPAGTLEPDEEPLACAYRELTEETGFTAKNMDYWDYILPLPSYSNEIIHVFKAYNLAPACQKLDADEILSVHKIKVAEALAMAKTGAITDGKTLACLFMINLRA